jgi:phosphate transport system substrate-binding protein
MIRCLTPQDLRSARLSIVLSAVSLSLLAAGCDSRPAVDPGVVITPEAGSAQPESAAAPATEAITEIASEQSTSTSGSQAKIDQALPVYEAVQGVAGNIKSTGSDSMNNLMTLWAEGFRKFYPSVQVEIEGKGSSTAPPALISGTANFGPMSRDMKPSEIDQFEARFGYPPTELRTAVDMLAVYVNKDNPLESLTLPQVDAIFSVNRSLGHAQDIRTWDQLGLKGSFANKPISMYGRNSASGTYGFFKEHALGKGDYKDSVKEQPGSSSVVQSITSDQYGIGYSGIGYKTAGVNAVAVAAAEGEKPVPASIDYAYSGEYPLSRTLNVVVNYKPGGELDPLRREFVRYVYSRQGQQDVIKDGYFPVTAEMAREALKSIGIEPGF